MSIINTSATVQSLTIDQKKAKVKAQVTTTSNLLFKVMRENLTVLFSTVFDNELGLTPQQVFDSFGADAAELAGILQGIGEAVSSLLPGGTGLSLPVNLVSNPDGTVTVAPKV